MTSLPRRLRRRLGRAALRAQFLLLQRHRHRRLVLEEIAGISLVVLPEVFHPGLFFSSKLLAEVVAAEALDGRRVLEMGTGTGFLALVAARRAARAVGTDINPEAVRALKINALLNRLEDRVEARQGDLFAPVAGERFDLILFNPPYFSPSARGQPADLWEYAWRDVGGVRARFVAEAARYLTPGGRLLICDSDVAVDRMDQALAAAGFRVRPVRARTIVSGEVLTVFAADSVAEPAQRSR
ncbi:MAG TPA: HemK2/MTQ2 family protein methyltransferase [Polyangia bacterium]|nr:HemK2/MTQ2 family protein methyltransferase [Polyangia bacterium]